MKFLGMGFSAPSSIYMPYLEPGKSQLEINFIVQSPQFLIYY